MNSTAYINLLNTKIFPSINQYPRQVRDKMIFMQDSAPSHASGLTRGYLEDCGFVGARYMDWTASSPDLNPIENYWSLLKGKIYEVGKQYYSSNELWNGISDAFSKMDGGVIQTLTKFVDSRVVEVLKNSGNYICH